MRSSLAAVLAAAFSLAPLAAHAQLFADDEARRAILQLRERVTKLQSEVDAKMDKAGTLDLANENEALRQEIARLRKLEPQKIVVDGEAITVQQAEQRAYEAALAYFREGDYRNAAASFYDFTHRYPQSGLAPSAQYWLGNTYYAQRDYTNAIAAHKVVLDRYPNHARAPEALLNISSCHVELKNPKAAREALDSLLSRYPDSPAASTARERLQSLK